MPTPPSLKEPGAVQLPGLVQKGTRPGEIPGRRRNAKEWPKPSSLVKAPSISTSPAEAVKRDAEVAREKFIDATGDYLATVIGDPLFFAATKPWHTESDPASEAIDATEAISGGLQGAVDAPLEGIGTALGLSPVEAAFTAGVSTNLILAPITGPLDKAETYIGICGIIFGLVTGGHGFVLACIKPLLHQQVHHALAQAVVEVFGGSQKDRPRSDSRGAVVPNLQLPSDIRPPASTQNVIQTMSRHHVARTGRMPMPQETPETRRQPPPGEPLWLCIAFMSKPSDSSAAVRTTPTRTAAKRDVTKPVVLPLGDDAFLRSLPGALEGAKVSQVDVPTAQTLNEPPPGQHFVIKLEGVRIGSGPLHTQPCSQAAYQHPGCRAGRCVPPDGPRCWCTCSVCRFYRPE
ncbi:MAG: hypothetical protein JO287_25690 [Pseudonocardiales bacterium]|nr:hypothetical protein [Pseudonocardiales bacterium]